jgi:hypothetical protein
MKKHTFELMRSKALRVICLLFFSMGVFAQKTQILTTDSTGNTFVVFMKNDSVGVVFRGKNTAFTTDGIFAKNFTAFDLKFEGFSLFNIKKNEKDLGDVVKPPDIVTPPDTVIAPPNEETVVFPVNVNYQNPRYWIEPYNWDKAPSKRGVIKGMNGYDFAPIVANQKSFYDYGAWSQGYISIGQKDTWNDNGKYFLKPKGYKTNLSYHLMDFDLKFPDFTLPKNKYVVMQPTPSREIGVNNYLRKGVSFVKSRNDSKGYAFVSDAWLLELGCPTAYVSTQEAMDLWCESIDADVLLKSFVEKVYFPNRDLGYIMLNWETVGNRWHKRQDKLIRCLEFWQNNPHTAQMALWTVGGINMGRPIFQGYGQDFSNLLTFDGNLDEFKGRFGEYVSVNFTYAKYVEVGHIGGYQNLPVEEGIIHHYLTELLLNRKYNPSKVMLATIWFDQEPISTFDLERVRVESSEGIYFAQVKPKVTPSVAFNWGVWTLVGDGLDCWSDPNTWSENKSDWGWGANDVNGNQLPIKHGENLSKYPSQPMKNIDWIMSGIWAMSENKDIIEYNSEWNFVSLPTKSYYEKSVLIAYKIKDKEVLVLGLDGFCNPDDVKEHKFEINGKGYKIKTYGRFTSVVKMNL